MRIFLQIPGIQGQSSDPQHQGWIDLLTVSFGVRDTAVPGGAAEAYSIQFDSVMATKVFDATSFLLYDQVVNGSPTNGAVIEIVIAEAGNPHTTTYRLELVESMIASVSSQAQAAADQDEETVQFSCLQMRWLYKSTDPTSKAIVNTRGVGTLRSKSRSSRSGRNA
ncbi:MAG: type VI secretion system tube protein Hcp [Candidatus Eremiobacteraeota bacterium]|nr:type VI secretion system tube protein Hcp [Candidatus Eremiobacteraeota bacterium]